MGMGLSALLSPITYGGVFLYAPFMSFRAVKSPAADDDKQWLMFWVVWSSLTAVEKFSLGLLNWMPLYYEAKAALVVYLMLFNGGQQVFDTLIDPLFSRLQKGIPKDQLELFEKDPKAYLEKFGARAYEVVQKKLADAKSK
eukprot:TRINITY_DN55164_c0_g1_i1.p1 TRINITY_DN55164_c0_g1~~TRINITY_DN55164_c0_g1_i1.p1  ORF type:complete len:141 (+),score=44.68 TRINITY_DN55164_c0_g1_i1:67-489(+)